MSVESPYLTVREFARLLNVNTRLVYSQIWAGELPAVRFGGVYRIHRDVILMLQTDRDPTQARRYPKDRKLKKPGAYGKYIPGADSAPAEAETETPAGA